MSPEPKLPFDPPLPMRDPVEILVVPRFVCAICFHEMTPVLEVSVVYCNSPHCRQFEKQVAIDTELRRLSL